MTAAELVDVVRALNAARTAVRAAETAVSALRARTPHETHTGPPTGPSRLVWRAHDATLDACGALAVAADALDALAETPMAELAGLVDYADPGPCSSVRLFGARPHRRTFRCELDDGHDGPHRAGLFTWEGR